MYKILYSYTCSHLTFKSTHKFTLAQKYSEHIIWSLQYLNHLFLRLVDGVSKVLDCQFLNSKNTEKWKFIKWQNSAGIPCALRTENDIDFDEHLSFVEQNGWDEKPIFLHQHENITLTQELASPYLEKRWPCIGEFAM